MSKDYRVVTADELSKERERHRRARRRKQLAPEVGHGYFAAPPIQLKDGDTVLVVGVHPDIDGLCTIHAPNKE
jgi:hypothetical protein